MSRMSASRTRADAGRRPGRRHHRLFVLLLHQPVGCGVPLDDIVVLLMADYGVNLYGNAIIVGQKFAAEIRRR